MIQKYQNLSLTLLSVFLFFLTEAVGLSISLLMEELVSIPTLVDLGMSMTFLSP